MNVLYKAMFLVIIFPQKFYGSFSNLNSKESDSQGILQFVEYELWHNESDVNLNNQNAVSLQKEEGQPSFTCDDFKLLVSRFGLCICGCIPCLLCITEYQKE